MKFMRKLPIVVLFVLVAAGLSSCGSSNPNQYNGAYGAAGVGPGYSGQSYSNGYSNNQGYNYNNQGYTNNQQYSPSY